MLKHNNHLKNNNNNLKKIPSMTWELREAWLPLKMTVSNVKQQQYCNYNSDMNKRRYNSKISLRIGMI